METPETIRTSLQTGEWITSIDFKDAYFHIPINNLSRKYMRFHIQGETYHFKALPFGLSTAPMEFTIVAKEVKLLAMKQGIRIHQYLDDWLVRARSHQTCLHHTQTLVALCRELGWVVNEEKSELEPKQVFNFVGYDLKEGRVRFLKGSNCEGTKVAVTLVPNAYHNIRWASSSRENTLQLAQYGSKSELTVPAHPRIQLSPQDYNPFASFQNSSNGKKYLLIRPGVSSYKWLLVFRSGVL